jgi:hypothetical protein
MVATFDKTAQELPQQLEATTHRRGGDRAPWLDLAGRFGGVAG